MQTQHERLHERDNQLREHDIQRQLQEQKLDKLSQEYEAWRGGERAAGFMTLVSSALRNDLDVWAYVNDVLIELLSGLTDYESLLPWNWKAEHPESTRTYRLEERQVRRVRQQATRAHRRESKHPAEPTTSRPSVAPANMVLVDAYCERSIADNDRYRGFVASFFRPQPRDRTM